MSTLRTRLTDLRHHWIGLILAVGFWCILWQGVTAMTVIGGLAVAIVLQVLFPMPALGGEVTLRPLRALHFTVKFLWDMTVSGLIVAAYALKPGPTPGSSVVAVQLRSRSDLFLTFTAMLATLIPGSVVVEAQRSTGTVFLHFFAADTPDAVEKVRRSIVAQEKRALLAFGRTELLAEAGYTAAGDDLWADDRVGNEPGGESAARAETGRGSMPGTRTHAERARDSDGEGA